MERLTHKVVLISGAGRGQGRSHAVRCAEEGADIIAFDVAGVSDLPANNGDYELATADDLKETVRQVEAIGRRIVAKAVDARDRDGLEQFVSSSVAELGGRLDVVSINHAVSLGSYRVHEIPPSLWDAGIDNNLTSAWNVVRATVPHMINAGNGGAIVITSSVSAFEAYENIGQYSTAKAGLIGLMRTCARELAPYSIRVNSLHPSQVRTDMITRPSIFKLFCPDIEDPTEEQFAERSKAMHLLPIPWLEPIDISNALLFLANDEGRYITGQSLSVDGGATLK